MKLTEERTMYIIGVLLTIVLLCQVVGTIAGKIQEQAYEKINWQISHSTKVLSLLSNFANLFILDKENVEKNFENYRNGLNETYKQHQQMQKEELHLLRNIEYWGWVENSAGIVGLFITIIVMILYLNLIDKISQRINKNR